MNNLASTLRAQGDHTGARALLEQVLDIQRRVLGPEHPNTLTSMNNLAGTLASVGEHDAAAALIAQVLDGFRRVLGPTHPHTLTTMGNRAVILLRSGHRDEALSLLREAHALAVAAHPDLPLTRQIADALARLDRGGPPPAA